MLDCGEMEYRLGTQRGLPKSHSAIRAVWVTCAHMPREGQKLQRNTGKQCRAMHQRTTHQAIICFPSQQSLAYLHVSTSALSLLKHAARTGPVWPALSRPQHPHRQIRRNRCAQFTQDYHIPTSCVPSPLCLAKGTRDTRAVLSVEQVKTRDASEANLGRERGQSIDNCPSHSSIPEEVIRQLKSTLDLREHSTPPSEGTSKARRTITRATLPT